MRALVQRSRDARVSVGGSVVAGFDGPGLVVLVGVTHDDTSAMASRLADKVYDLRIFGPQHSVGDLEQDSAREMSAADLRLPVLVVSQFTLYADTRKGRRPTWDAAAPGPVAEPLVDAVAERLRQRDAVVTTGVFGAEMQLTLTNDGPMTISIEV